MLGPLGAGKSMLARRLTPILPAMTLPEAIETTRIHRAAGLTGDRTLFVTMRPFRAPYHDHAVSDVRLIGGGQVPMSDEVSLAHPGILFNGPSSLTFPASSAQLLAYGSTRRIGC